MNQFNKSHSDIKKQFIQEKIVYKNNIDEYENQDIFSEVKAILQDKIQLAQSDADNQYYEIIQKDCDKGKAIQRLQERLEIKQEETICFGDGQNDIVMSQVADIVVAMKRSHQMLKNVATSVCEDIFDHGIYKELKRKSII